MIHLAVSCRTPHFLLNGQVRMQFEQHAPLLAQKAAHFFASICQVNKPCLLDLSIGVSVGFSRDNAWLGQCSAHFLQVLQNSQTPNSMGLSGTRGRFVKTLAIRTLGPNSGVISMQLRPSSPRPASIAKGILQAVSFPQGMALYPIPRMYVASYPAAKAIRE